MKLLHYSILLFTLLFPSLFFAQSELTNNNKPKRVYVTKALQIGETITIDGQISEKGWSVVDWTADFIEQEPNENTAPSQLTRFKITYDDKNLYAAFRAYDSAPDSIVRRLSRRDGFAGDRINFVIDSYHDERTAFVFTVTAAGVKGDEIATNNGDNIDDSWNPIWYTKVAVDEEGWTAEMRIPLSQLRFGKSKEQVWGLNVRTPYF